MNVGETERESGRVGEQAGSGRAGESVCLCIVCCSCCFFEGRALTCCLCVCVCESMLCLFVCVCVRAKFRFHFHFDGVSCVYFGVFAIGKHREKANKMAPNNVTTHEKKL